MATGKSWWDADRIEPVLRDLVSAELARLRPGQPAVRPGCGDGASADPVAADSLELLSIVTAVSRYFHLHETGLDDLLLARRGPADWARIVIRSRSAWDEAVTFATSGSTGEPKACTHPIADLEAELDLLVELFADRRRIIGVQPTHHIYGFLFTVMLPAALGIPVVDLRGVSPASLLRKTRPGDLVVAHPQLLDLVASVASAVPNDVGVVTSTAPCGRSTVDRLMAAGVSGVVEVYGSSETAGIGYRRSPNAPYTLMPQWARSRCDGRLLRGRTGLEAAVPDHLDWIGDREFRVGARIDGAVQVGGINVFPSRVRDLLLQHPGVADAAVRAMRRDEGGRLKAFVVPRAGPSAAASLSAELSRWLDARLQSVEIPRSFTFGPALPVTAAGKPDDWLIARGDA